MRDMQVISILNLKGGVAKTFTAVNMAYEFFRRGYRVLLFDNDKQGNLSKAYGRYDADVEAPAAKLLSGNWKETEELIQKTEYEGIDIISSNLSLFGATWNLTKEDSVIQTESYRKFLDSAYGGKKENDVCSQYDYCIIDNPPDIGINVVNALVATDTVLIPVKVDEDSLEGLDIVAGQIEDVRILNHKLKIAGVLITNYQNTDGEKAGAEWLKAQGKYKIIGKIRYSKKVAENSFMRKPIYEYSPLSAAAQDYKKFVGQYIQEKRKRR